MTFRSIVFGLITLLFIFFFTVEKSDVLSVSYITDTFTRTTANGWGTNDSGQTYSIIGSSSSFSTNGSAGVISMAAGNSREAYVAAVSQTDTETNLRFQVNALPTGSTTNMFTLTIVSRKVVVSPATEYRAKVNMTNAGAFSIVGSRSVNGSETNLGASANPGITPASNTWYRLRAQVEGTSPTSIRIKLWQEGSAEPVSWQYTTTDSEATLQAAGPSGVRTFIHSSTTNGPVSATIDDYTVESIPVPTATPTPTGTITDTCERPYASYGPWNTPIGENPIYNSDPAFFVDNNPDNPIRALATSVSGTPTYGTLTSDPTQYAYPRYLVDNSTPLQTVALTGVFSEVQDTNTDGAEDSTVRYPSGTHQVEIPLPAGIQGSTGSDSQLIIVNVDTGEEWGFWRVDKDGDGSWDTDDSNPVSDIWNAAGDGTYYATNGYYYKQSYTAYPPSSTTNNSQAFLSRGAGVPYHTGLIRPCEIVNGEIPHALAFAYNNPSENFVFPATKSDGPGTNSYDLPEGARLQLDPAITDTEITGWGCTGACFTIAKALQEYGMYLIDISGNYKIIPEDNKTANWNALDPQYIVSSTTVNPIPLNRFKLLSFPSEINELLPIPTPTPVTTPSPVLSSSPAPDGGTSDDGGIMETIRALFRKPATWSCPKPAPESAPDLFQIDSTATTASLHFSPATGSYDTYVIAYGFRVSAEQFGVEFPAQKEGVISYTINALPPDTRLYFKVRAGNGCMPGDWSRTMSITTGAGTSVFAY